MTGNAMKPYFFFAATVIIGTLLNYLLSTVLSRLAKQQSALPEKVLMSSVDDASSFRWKTTLTEHEKTRLWGDTMNIIMRAETETLAAKYVEKAADALGNLGPDFRKHAGEILAKRFGVDSKPKSTSIPCQD